MDKQATFDLVVRHLRTQKCRATRVWANRQICAYRGMEKGKKVSCAAGCLIPDDKYVEQMEGSSVTINNLVDDCLRSLGYDLEFVRRLQMVHDDHLEKDWENEFRAAAEEYNLKLEIGNASQL